MKSLIITFCALGIIFSVISSITDTSKFEKEFRLIFTSITLIVLVKSFLRLDLSFLNGISLESNPYTIENISTQDYTQDTIEAQVKSSIETFLNDNGIQCKNISVSINITDDNCISINKVAISTDNFQLAKTLLIKNFGDILVINNE